jgi:hypothetical protein
MPIGIFVNGSRSVTFMMLFYLIVGARAIAAGKN